jgi:F420-dependent oxidoreductase-like protein
MRIGINGTGLVQKASAAAICDDALKASEDGFQSYWLAEHPTGGFDALTVLSAVGQKTPNMELGTAIIPTHPRHPMILAGQALTVANMMDAPLTLGIGLSHEIMMEQLGIGFDKPIRHLREYLSVLMPLLHTGEVNFTGNTLKCQAKVFREPKTHVPVLVAALGPQALKVAGEMTEGTTLAWVGPKTVKEHIVPRITEAASNVGREAPRVLATLPVCVTDQPEKVRRIIDKNLKMYGELPSYRAMLDREGVAGPADVAIVGSSGEVVDGISEMELAGVTDFAVSEFFLNSQEAVDTRQTLVSLMNQK